MLRLVQNPERLRRQPESRFRWISLAEDRETCRGAAQEGAESAHGTPSRTVPPRQRQRHAPRRKPADLVPERQLLQCNAHRRALLPAAEQRHEPSLDGSFRHEPLPFAPPNRNLATAAAQLDRHQHAPALGHLVE